MSKPRPDSMMFVTVPETTLPSGRVVPEFRVSRYVCTQGKGGRAAVSPEGAPWVRANYHEARAACEKAGYVLITESQWLAMAYQIARQAENWTGGKVGDGKLYQGLRKQGWSYGAQPGNIEPADFDERRWFVLPNGERIWDAAGNVFQWVFDDVQGNNQGLVAKSFTADSPSLVIPYPKKECGQGWTPRAGANWSGRALVRGGCWRSEARAGAFYLAGGWPDRRLDSVGFRCTQPIGL